MDRRRLLRFAARSLLAVPAAVLAVPALGYLTAVGSGRPATERRVSLGALASLDLKPSRRLVRVDMADAWVEASKEFVLWMRIDESGEPIAFAAACPHQGCPVEWVEEENLFVCPCHRSVFRIDGSRAGGPSDKPLRKVPLETGDGELFINAANLFSD
jgi:menaquinol-cytochrome c reductase iron-sulfur subunit